MVLASCPSGSAFTTAGIAPGTHRLTVTATDDVGTYSATRMFNIETTACIAIYPPPPGCPGYVPPGGGGVIGLP